MLGAPQKDILAILDALQSELFTLGDELATPQQDKAPRDVPHIEAHMIARMEKDIDRFTADLPEMRQFILPGGHPLAAALHVSRTVCRRAERRCVALARAATDLNPEIVRYLNRLSDLLFVLARYANHRNGLPDVAWQP